MTPVLTLIDDSGNSYTFPEDFWLRDFNLPTNISIKNYTFNAGGRNTADGYPQARQITIQGRLRGDSLSALETKKRAFFFATFKGGKLQMSDDTVSRYIYVKFPDFSDGIGDWRYSENITITFIAENPFWMDSAQTTVTKIVTGNDSITVDATGSDFLMFPTIEIENDQSVDNPTVKMYNQDDGSGFFEYADIAFLDGDLLVINSELGTIKKNSNDAFNGFVTPRFLRLQPQSNTFQYEGAACTIRIKYRKVYA